jgi:hypothetical protein
MKTLNNRLHAVVVALAYTLVALQIYVFPIHYTTDTLRRPTAWLRDIGTLLAIVATIAGFVMMARRRGKSESILLGISTVAAFVLIILTGSLWQ